MLMLRISELSTQPQCEYRGILEPESHEIVFLNCSGVGALETLKSMEHSPTTPSKVLKLQHSRANRAEFEPHQNRKISNSTISKM
ncbi:hypothetical protein K0M31_015866 [Melipona bicolor]|uniref:Uncharacterized protein n=1 Tax=Melipona bicolor TaxID=60889 RepID=A0AA40G655_9HYME|nr:hypothetical protein K0M31_015866 [Melipona bicolor]